MARVSCAWQGWPGSPGVTQLYLLNPPVQGNIDAIRTFWNAFPNLLPAGLTIQVPNTGDVVSETDGSITGTWSVATLPAVVTGSSAGTYAGNAGAVVHWLTAGVVAGRRVRGRTFIVPLATGYASDGSLASSTITTLSNAAAAYVTAQAGVAVVWARPAPGRSGTVNSITASRVPDLAVSLRSRRT